MLFAHIQAEEPGSANTVFTHDVRGLARARALPRTQASHTLQSSKSGQHSGWKHPSLLPTRADRGLSPSRAGSGKGGFSHALCAAACLLGSVAQEKGTGRGSLSSGSVDPPFCNPRGFFNRQPTQEPNLDVQHYPCRVPRPLTEGAKDTCSFFFSLVDKHSSRDI